MIPSLVATYSYPGVEMQASVPREARPQTWLVFHYPKSGQLGIKIKRSESL